MSLFKRKGRRIVTRDDEEADDASVSDGESPVQAPVRFSGGRRNKQSTLRRSTTASATGTDADVPKEGEEEEDDGPAVVRPTIGRTKKNVTSSSLSQRVLETNAFRKSLSGRLPTRPLGREEDEQDRPRYSKEYLDELQNSTPNMPRDLSDQQNAGAGSDSMELDASELEGAMVVESSDLGTAVSRTRAAPAAHVLTQTEIQERKDRRARMALEQGALALGSEDDEENGYISLMTTSEKKKRKEQTRLVREDEDLGEGYDEFVEDGGLSLGRKAEREARRRRKKEMESLIREAEDVGEGDEADVVEPRDSDDSEAERRAAYNAAQTRAGMDGLHRHGGSNEADEEHGVAGAVYIPKMRPLPDFDECLARMQRLVQNLEDEVAERRRKLQEVEAENAEILAREAEVQEVLNKAGEKYKALLGGKAPPTSSISAVQSPLRQLALGPAERGLESLGGTPLRQSEAGG